MSGCMAGLNLDLNLRFPFVACGFKITLGLHVDPVVWGRVEVASEPQGCLPGNGALASDDAGNPVCRYMQRLSQTVHADSQIVQCFFENFSGMNGWQLAGPGGSPIGSVW